MVDLVRMRGVKTSCGWIIHLPLTFQVWCKIESYPSPFRVQVCQNAQVYDVVEAAIEKGTHPGRVIVKFQGDSVMPDAQISQYSTSDVNPLLLEVVEPEGKLHAVMYIIYRCWWNHVIYILVAMVLSQAVQQRVSTHCNVQAGVAG